MATALSVEHTRGSRAGSSSASGGLSLGGGADGVPAAAGATNTAAAAVGEQKVLVGAEGESLRELASPSPGDDAESAAVPESGKAVAAAAAGLGNETISEEELDASMCNEMDDWIGVNGRGSKPEGEGAPLRPHRDDPAHERTDVLGSEAAAAMAAAAIADGGKSGAGKSPDQAAVVASSLLGGDGKGIRVRAEVEARPASIEVVPRAPTAPAIAKEVGTEGVGGRSEPLGEAGAMPSSTAAPPLDMAAAAPAPAQAETAPLPASLLPAPEQGLIEGSSSTKVTSAGTAGVAIEGAPAAGATAVPIESAPEPPGAAIPGDSALLAGGRDRADGVKGPQPPPSAPSAASAAACGAAEGGDGAMGSCAESDASKEDAAVGGSVVNPEKKLSVTEAVKEGATVGASTGDSGIKEKAAAAKATAEAATAAAVLASADAATAGVWMFVCECVCPCVRVPAPVVVGDSLSCEVAF